MTMRIIIAALAFSLSSQAIAVVKRHDVAPEQYQLNTAPSFFVNMPHEGAGVLIDEQWVLSAGHVIYYEGYEGKSLVIQGVENEIAKIVFHPNYKQLPAEPFTGDAQPLMDYLYGRVDLVLVKLVKPVSHVMPIARYYQNDELSKATKTYGTGATGTGLTGEQLATKTQRQLNYFTNHIEGVTPHYLKMRFDQPETALPLEGIHGSGDSGGPTVVEAGGTAYLVGIQAFRDYQGDLDDFKGGLYNSVSVLTRVSAFNQWIDQTISQN